MKLLLVHQDQRFEMFVAPSMAVRDFKHKLIADKVTTADHHLIDLRTFYRQSLPDEEKLADCLQDRDRLELIVRQPGPFDHALSTLHKYELETARLEGQNLVEHVRDELVTQLLQKLDAISTEGLNETERADFRARRKDLVRRAEVI